LIENVEYESDMQVQNDLLDKDDFDENFKLEEKNYFENIENLVSFNVVSKYHKKYFMILLAILVFIYLFFSFLFFYFIEK